MMKMRTLAAMVALAAAGSANAEIYMSNTENSSLVLAVWDNVAQESYIRNLGYRMLDFVPSQVTSDAGHTVNFAADPVFSSLFGDNTPADVFWNITAADGTGPGATAGRQLLGTGILGTETSSYSVTNAGVSNTSMYWGSMQAPFHNANNQPSPDGTTCATSMSCYSTNSGDLQYTGDQWWFNNWGDNLRSWINAGSLGESLGFYSMTPNGTFGINQATKTRYENSYGLASWTLAADGSLTYDIPGAAAVVPVPAAVWLLGSGLVGLVGVARRRAVK